MIFSKKCFCLLRQTWNKWQSWWWEENYRSDFWNSFPKPRYRALSLLFWPPEKSLRDPISQFKEGISKIALIFFLSLPRWSFMPNLIKRSHLYLGKNHTGFDFTLYSLWYEAFCIQASWEKKGKSIEKEQASWSLIRKKPKIEVQ